MLVSLSFALIYGLAHLYFFFKVSAVPEPVPLTKIIAGPVILLMALSPVLTHLYSLKGPAKTSKLLAYASNMWVALLIVFTPPALCLDLYNLTVRHGIISPGKGLIPLSSSYVFFIPLLIAVFVSAYGLFEANSLRIEKLTVRTGKLPRLKSNIRIVQISDLHLGVMTREATLDKIITSIKDSKPDLIVSTGDLLDGVLNHIEHLAEKLQGLQAGMGKFAVIGNHEYFGGLKRSLRFIENSGFTLLRGEGITINSTINIAGIDDLAEMKNGSGGAPPHRPEKDILSALPSGIFTLLLKHRAEVDRSSPGLFDLQLSGHTHRGQIFPVSLVTPFIFQYHSGFQRLARGSALYVSRGIGTAGPPVRFLSPPELTIIDIVREDE